MSVQTFFVPFELGAVVVARDEDGKVRGVSFRTGTEDGITPSSCALARGIDAYLRGRSRLPDASLALPTEPAFTARVWRVVMRIPHGATATYGEVAAAAGRKGAARAVGRAMASNPIPLFVPCHRVVASRGLGGFSSGLAVKRWLLELEGGRKGGRPSSESPLGPGQHRRRPARRNGAGASCPPGRRESR